LFWDSGIESGEKLGLIVIRNKKRVIEHISFIATENNDLEYSPSVQFLYLAAVFLNIFLLLCFSMVDLLFRIFKKKYLLFLLPLNILLGNQVVKVKAVVTL